MGGYLNYCVIVSNNSKALLTLLSKYLLEFVPYRISISNNVIFISGFHIYNKFRKIYFLNSIFPSYFHSKKRKLFKHQVHCLILTRFRDWMCLPKCRHSRGQLPWHLLKGSKSKLLMNQGQTNTNLNPPSFLYLLFKSPIINMYHVCSKKKRK